MVLTYAAPTSVCLRHLRPQLGPVIDADQDLKNTSPELTPPQQISQDAHQDESVSVNVNTSAADAELSPCPKLAPRVVVTDLSQDQPAHSLATAVHLARVLARGAAIPHSATEGGFESPTELQQAIRRSSDTVQELTLTGQCHWFQVNSDSRARVAGLPQTNSFIRVLVVELSACKQLRSLSLTGI